MSSSEVVDEFLACARQYIALVDRVSTLTRCEFLASCACLLPRIYALGQALPEPSIEQEEPPEPPVVQNPMAAIGSLLGDANLYSEVWDPVIDSTALKTYLSDDLADIYCDLAAPLGLYERGSAADRAEALWDWRFNIMGHCGEHIVDCLRPIHRLLYDHLCPEQLLREPE